MSEEQDSNKGQGLPAGQLDWRIREADHDKQFAHMPGGEIFQFGDTPEERHARAVSRIKGEKEQGIDKGAIEIKKNTNKFLQILGILEADGPLKYLANRIQKNLGGDQIASYEKKLQQSITDNSLINPAEYRRLCSLAVGTILENLEGKDLSDKTRQELALLTRRVLNFGQEPNKNPQESSSNEVANKIYQTVLGNQNDQAFSWHVGLMAYTEGVPLAQFKGAEIAQVVQQVHEEANKREFSPLEVKPA